MEAERGIPIFDPTVAPEAAAARRAPRDGVLAGKRIGFLWNSKVNGDTLMRFILEELRAGGADLAFAGALKKETDTRPATEATYDRLARECDLVLTALGD